MIKTAMVKCYCPLPYYLMDAGDFEFSLVIRLRVISEDGSAALPETSDSPLAGDAKALEIKGNIFDSYSIIKQPGLAAPHRRLTANETTLIGDPKLDPRQRLGSLGGEAPFFNKDPRGVKGSDIINQRPDHLFFAINNHTKASLLHVYIVT
jgi:hypothetical protein